MEFAVPLFSGVLAGSIIYFSWFMCHARFEHHPVSGSHMDRTIDLSFVVLAVIMFVILAILSLGRFEAFNIYGRDFALFDQVIWNTAHGRLLENTIVEDSPILLAQRFSPILFAFVPLYAVLSDPRVLVFTPVMAATVAAFPLYWFARRRIGRVLALVVGVAFLIAPGLQIITLDQFKEIILTIPFLMLATTFLLEGKDLPFLGSLGLAMMCKEEIGFIAAAFGAYIFFVQRRFLFGGALGVFGAAWVIFLVQVVIPHFQGGSVYYYFEGSEAYGSGLYDYLGGNVSEIAVTLITRPDIVLQNVLIPEKIDAVVRILLPLGTIALLGLDVSLLALPTLGYTLLSNRRFQFLFGSYHYSPVYVFLFVGLVIGLERLVRWSELRGHVSAAQRLAIRAALGGFVLVSSLSSYYLNAPGPLSRNFDPNFYTPTPHDRLGAELASRISQDAIVLTQTELVSRLGERRYLYMDGPWACLSNIDYVFADTRRPWYSYREQGWQEVLGSEWFESLAEDDGYILRKRSATLKLDQEVNARFGEDVMLIGYALPLISTVTGGQGLRVLTGWKAERQVTERYVVRLDLYDLQGHLWAQTAQEPCGGIRPTNEWTPGQINYDDKILRLPPTMPAGNYRVMLALYSRSLEDAVEVRDSFGRSQGTEIEVASLRVTKNKKSFTASDLWIEQRYFVDMDEMRLLGFKPIPPQVRIGAVLPIGLYWRARGKPQGDYVTVVQLRDENGRIVIEHAARPANNTYPTTQWDVGEVLLDWHDVVLPKDVKVGTFEIVISLRDVTNARVLGEALIGTIQIVP